MVPAVPRGRGRSQCNTSHNFLQSASHTFSHLIFRRAAAPTPTPDVLFLPPFYRWGKWSLKSWYNFPKATQLINGRAMIQIQAYLTPRLRFFCVLVATVPPLWESQEAVGLPGLTVEDDLDIYQVYLQVQVLSRLNWDRWSEFQKSGLTITE